MVARLRFPGSRHAVVWLALLFWALTAQAALPIQHWQTASGVRVYFVENRALPIIDLSVTFPAGSSRDPQGQEGVASLTRHLLTLGAAGMSDAEIAERLADVGAVLGGEFDADRAGLSLRTLSSERESGQALEVYARLLQQPDFPADVLEREKARVIAALREAETQPDSIAARAFAAALYGDHPYGRRQSGEIATVSALRREHLVELHRRHYTAEAAVIALIGDMSRARAEGIAEMLSAGLPRAQQAGAALPPVAYPAAPVRRVIPHPATQSHILLGYPGVKRGDADYFPLYVGNYILGGGGFVSRLTEEVREKRGLVYSVYSYFMPMAELGPFQIGLQTQRAQGGEALDVVRGTLRRFIDEGPTEQELQAAKDNIVGGFPLRFDSNRKILDHLAMIGFYRLPLTYLDDFVRQIDQVTTAQIRAAFQRRIVPDRMVTVIVAGDAE